MGSDPHAPLVLTDPAGATARGASAQPGADWPPPAAARAFNAANAAFRTGRWQAACAAAETALQAAPDLVVAAVLLGRARDRLGEAEAALAAYDRAVAQDPACFDAHLERGNLLRRTGRADAARDAYRAAIRARPADTRGHLALARLEEEAGDGPARERAAVAFAEALDRAADASERAGLHRTLAGFRRERGDLPAALDSLRQADLTLAAAGAGATGAACALALDQAEVLLRLGLVPQAEAAMQRSSAATDEAVLRRLADLAYRFNYWQEAIAVLRRNADLRPDDSAARLAVAEMLERSWRPGEALVALERAEALGPVPEETGQRLRAQIAKALGDVETARSIYARLAKQAPERYAPGLAMLSLYSDRLSTAEVAMLHRRLFAPLGTEAAGAPRRRRKGKTRRPLRVGMVTPDLHRQHPVALLLEPLLEHWDRERLPLTLYFTGTMVDAVTRRARARVDGWRMVTPAGLPDSVADDEIDILIDLSGHTAGNAMAAFARRLAPVQISYLGYPGSTGVPNIDWLVGDEVVTPPEHDALCSERVLRLPDTVFCYTPTEDYKLPDFAARMADRPLTFGSFNNLPKLSGRTVRLWSAVLRDQPKARLLLKAPSLGDPAAAAWVRGLFAAEGVATERIECRGPTGLAEMMGEYADIDIALDPVPYNGGMTTLQAMWMGVPVLTLAGGSFVARMGASFMSGAGLGAWVATDEEDFVVRARSLAADRAALVTLKAGLRDRLRASPAWDGARYARGFAEALETAWAES